MGGDEKYLYSGRKVLSPAAKAHVDRMVGEIHVAAPDEEAVARALRGLVPEAPEWFKAAVAREAKRAHARHLKLYCAVMGGGL